MRKQDAVKFKWAICTVFGVVFENIFMQMNSIIQSLLNRNISQLEFSHIFVFWDSLFIVCEYEFSPELETTEARIYDMLWMWRLQLLLTMNDRLILASKGVFVWICALKWGFISAVCAIYSGEKKRAPMPQSPFLYLEMHCLCSVVLAVGCIRTCSLLDTELPCNTRGKHFVTGLWPCKHTAVLLRV